MQFETSTLNLGQAFQVIIADHLKSYPNISLRALASRDNGLNREFVRRLATGQINEERIDKDKALRLLVSMSKKTRLSEIAQYYGDPIATWLRESFEINWKNETQIAADEVDYLLATDEDECVAYHLAHSDAGVSIAQARAILGSQGQSALESLERKGLIVDDGSSFRGREARFFQTSIETAKKVLQTFVRFYKPAHFGKKRNYIMTFSGSLNQSGVEAQQEAYRRFHQEIRQIYENKNYKGNIHTFSVACMDSFAVLEDDQDEIH
jgi:hypothetical protein